MKKLIFALTASAAVAATAHAQTAGRPYVGLGVATANHNYSLAGTGATNIDNDGWKPSAKVFGGYDFTQNLGVEVGYTDFRSSGRASVAMRTATAPTWPPNTISP
jgi:OOP family OmpA-OmpF porin